MILQETYFILYQKSFIKIYIYFLLAFLFLELLEQWIFILF